MDLTVTASQEWIKPAGQGARKQQTGTHVDDPDAVKTRAHEPGGGCGLEQVERQPPRATEVVRTGSPRI